MAIEDYISRIRSNYQGAKAEILNTLKSQGLGDTEANVIFDIVASRAGVGPAESQLRSLLSRSQFGGAEYVNANFGSLDNLADFVLSGNKLVSQNVPRTQLSTGGYTGGVTVLAPTSTFDTKNIQAQGIGRPEPKTLATDSSTSVNAGQQGSYEGNAQAQGRDYYKVRVPVTAQNPGGYDIYKSDGTKVTDSNVFNPTSKGGLGLNADWIPDRTGSVQPGTNINNLYNPTGISSSIDFNKDGWWKAYGISDDIWNKLDASTKAFVQSSAQFVQGQYDQGMVNVSVNADLLNKALTAAQTDPNIVAKYGDALKLNQAGLQQTLAEVDKDYAQTMGLLNVQQENERKALAEAQAEAGRAYSGYRRQAEQQLAQQQSGIIESTKRSVQNKVNQLGIELEQKYGTGGLNQFGQIQTGGLAYNPVGGIKGTIEGQQKSDIEQRQLEIYNREKLV